MKKRTDPENKKPVISNLSNREKNAVVTFSRRIKKSLKKNLYLLQLFGSKANGTAMQNSDIDILIILNRKSLKWRKNIYDILFEIDPYYELKISTKIFSKFEYMVNKKLGSPFIENLEREAITL